ncbi:MAG: T9SS type A sorting domain-containing protein [Candidatus Marinimicrobia bacterium]|nr:T9SS type A sorting domain-containing protein [Candidatus Neomarinimicrobiota bacterium]
MMKKIITIVTIVALLFAVGLVAKPLDGQPLAKTAATTAGQVTRTLSNISNWSYWVYNNGQTGHAPDGSSGGVYPRGTAGAIYQDGFVWGGKFDTDGDGTGDHIRVGGQTYNIGTQSGRVITGGDYDDDAFVLANPADPLVRVFRIRPDYENLSHAMLAQDAAEQNEVSISSVTAAMTQEIIDQYALDWEEWPTAWGAPYYDLDDDGVYTAGIDEPGIAQADQVVWYVVNDYSNTVTTSLYGSPPIGVELQTTLWAYNQPGVRLGQIIFRSNKLINKSNTTLTDVYVSMWADPDLGSAGNDYAGCDTTLSLGYCYNGTATDGDYDAFDLAPPAFGYDFFQGPMVAASPGDTAIFELEYIAGYKNLPMTSYGWFAAGTAIEDPELGDYVGTLQFYNLMKGYKPTEDVIPAPWTLGNVAGAATTMYPLSGDPVAGTGDLDGQNSYGAPGDRRICVSSGPFTFAPGDVQEVVVAILGGLGADNIGSVAELKLTDDVAQILFDGLFSEIPKPPTSPEVVATSYTLDDINSIVLEWGSDPIKVAATEEPVRSGYVFEGYTVYQLPSSSSTKDQGVRIATYDEVNGITLIYETLTPNAYEGNPVSVPTCYGTDSGIKRHIRIDQDYINNAPLYEGSTYYFAVTAYNQSFDPERLIDANAMESAMIAFPVTIQEPLPGTMLNVDPEDNSIEITQTLGSGDGQVAVTVVDPYAVNGHDYEITFSYNADSTEILYNVVDETDAVTLSTGNSQLTSLTDKGGVIVDGVEIKVAGPQVGLKSVKEYDAAGELVDGGVSIVEFSLGSTGFLVSNRSGEFNQPPYTRDFDRFNVRGIDDIEIDFTDSSVCWVYASDTILFNQIYIPCAIYLYHTVSGVKERLYPAVMDDGDGIWDTSYAEPYWGVPSYEPLYAYRGATPYDPALESQYIAAKNLSLPPSNCGWTTDDYWIPYLTATLFVDYREGGLPIGNKVYFKTNKTIQVTDAYEFSTAGLNPESSDSLKALALEKINVYPNPYYAYNEQATTAYDQYVTFTHLPELATIKIFNLAGVLVTTLEHTADKGQFEKWDLTNASDIPVGSGMYIAHIDMPDEGVQKILKVMIVQKKQILEYY